MLDCDTKKPVSCCFLVLPARPDFQTPNTPSSVAFIASYELIFID
jgi:hypothetical protein